MESKSIYQFTKEGYTQYGEYVDNSRHIPLIFDGLKPSYRRTIYGALQLCGPKNKLIKVSQLSGYVIGNLHPHGTSSIEGVIGELVHAGIFEGQGSFGGATIMGDRFDMAAARYPSVRMNPHWMKIFSELLPYVEWEDSYIGVKMPSYLPTPIPLTFLTGSLGIGFGVSALIPNFGVKSLIEAFKSDDPYKLYPNYKDITFDYDRSGFEDLWNKGYSTITYIPKIYRGSSDDCGDGIYIESDPEFLVPNLDLIKEKVSQDRLFIRDESSGEHNKLFIGKYPSIHEDMNYYYSWLVNNNFISEMYRLYVTDGKTTRLISLKLWIKFLYERYLGYINKMKESKISKLQYEVEVLKLLPQVGKYIQDNSMKVNESDVISHFSNYDKSLVKACLGKPIRKLMKSDYENEINGLNSQIDKINSINPDKYVSDILDEMTK
jgi:hypothetical protein